MGDGEPEERNWRCARRASLRKVRREREGTFDAIVFVLLLFLYLAILNQRSRCQRKLTSSAERHRLLWIASSTGLGSLHNDLALVDVLPNPEIRALLTIQFLVYTAYAWTYTHTSLHNDPSPPIRPDPPLPPLIPRSVPNPSPSSPNHLPHNQQPNTPNLALH